MYYMLTSSPIGVRVYGPYTKIGLDLELQEIGSFGSESYEYLDTVPDSRPSTWGALDKLTILIIKGKVIVPETENWG